MSWTTGYCYLFVTCKDAEQCNELIQRFETEIQDANYFSLYQSHNAPLEVNFSLEDTDIPGAFDDIVKNVDKWLRTNFDLSFDGYWTQEVEGKHFRVEIHDGEIIETHLDWLETYPIEQIEKLRQYAETVFPQTPHNQQ